MIPLLLGLTIVLDAGHGGSEAGARGVLEGVVEKRVTLAYARTIKAKLEAAGARVVLTREDDSLLTIRERVRRANAARADAFVSVHLNASPDRTQRGYETYVLSAEAAEREAREHAQREAQGDGGAAAGIVADLEQERAEGRALRLGRAIQDALVRVLGKEGDRGLRQAALDVLKGHRAPAVLVEVGFIDHPEEGRLIVTTDTRERVSSAIARAIVESLREEARR
jgi:N-acetylmuramoyl-L-alanine amidase